MEIIYRPLKIEDTDQFYTLINQIKDEEVYLFSTSRFSIEETRKYVSAHIETDFPIWGAFDNNGILLGWIDCNKGGFRETAHVATMAMGVRKEYRGRGIGTQLIDKCLKSAKNNNVEKIELDVFSTNTGAYQLYVKKGFAEEGRKAKKRKFKGKYEDIICMYRFL